MNLIKAQCVFRSLTIDGEARRIIVRATKRPRASKKENKSNKSAGRGLIYLSYRGPAVGTGAPPQNDDSQATSRNFMTDRPRHAELGAVAPSDREINDSDGTFNRLGFIDPIRFSV